MKLWSVFFPPEDSDKSINSIHTKLNEELPQKEEKGLVTIACIAGLLARVAYSDLQIHDTEAEAIKRGLKEFTDLSNEEISVLSKIAQQEIKELVDHEHHLYVRPLNDLLSKEEKLKILRALFAVAAADGKVENLESEEIRRITKALLLSHDDFIQAKLTVKDKIGALK